MASPFLYFPGDRLSLAELTAARLDGDLIELGEGWIPADAVETAALRAASLRALTRETLAASHLSAAWVHGALDEPPVRHTLQRAVGRRLSQVVTRRAVYRDLRVEETDLVVLGGVAVTSVVRTLGDLARVADDVHVTAARRLAEQHPGLAAATIEHLRARGALPHKRVAIAFLRGLAAREAAAHGASEPDAPRCDPQEEVTR